MLKIPGQSSPIETLDETKLVGYWLTENMKPEIHVNFIVGKCYQCIWAVRKLKNSGVQPEDILRFYFSNIRSVLESSCQVFHSMLTADDKEEIERIQKIVLKIALGPQYTSYEDACYHMNIESLDSRRQQLSLKFALKLLDSHQHQGMFHFTEKSNLLLRHQPILKVPFAHTSRYMNSPLPSLTRILNDFFDKKILEGDLINIPSRYFPIVNLENGL